MPYDNYCDFTVYIKNGGGKGGIVVEATSMDTEIQINNVIVAEDIEEYENSHRFER